MIIKSYCIFAQESIDKMQENRGKMCAQAGHAFLHSFWDSTERFPEQAKAYRNSEHCRKITVVVDTVKELNDFVKRYRGVCGVSMVEDCGFTIFTEPTITCLGIGPISEDLIGDDLRNLKLFV